MPSYYLAVLAGMGCRQSGVTTTACFPWHMPFPQPLRGSPGWGGHVPGKQCTREYAGYPELPISRSSAVACPFLFSSKNEWWQALPKQVYLRSRMAVHNFAGNAAWRLRVNSHGGRYNHGPQDNDC